MEIIISQSLKNLAPTNEVSIPKKKSGKTLEENLRSVSSLNDFINDNLKSNIKYAVRKFKTKERVDKDGESDDQYFPCLEDAETVVNLCTWIKLKITPMFILKSDTKPYMFKVSRVNKVFCRKS